MSLAGADSGPPRRLIAIVLAILVIRLVVAAVTPLTEDEAYYRLWAQAPALGYVDHPPMIAWWIAIGRAVAGDTPLGVRLLPCLASALTSLLVFDMASMATGARVVGERAAVWFNATLLVALGAMLAVPDAPAALFWCLALWCLMRDQARPRLLWWIGAGVAAGLACLSKYSALFLGPGILIWLVADRGRVARLATSGPWLALVVTAALFGLNVFWNAHHGWLTFAKQFGRVAGHHVEWRFLPELVGAQILLLNPLLFGFLTRARVSRAAPASLFLLTSLPFAAYLLIHSLHDRVQAHWPAPLYPSLVILAALAANGLSSGLAARFRRAVPAFALGCLTLIVVLVAAPVSVFDNLPDPFLPLRGWSDFSNRLEAERQGSGAAWVGVSSYGLASELSAQGLSSPLWQISERDRWLGPSPGERPDLSRSGLVVDLPRRISASKLRTCFASVQPLPSVPRGAPGERPKMYAAFLVGSPIRPALQVGCW